MSDETPNTPVAAPPVEALPAAPAAPPGADLTARLEALQRTVETQSATIAAFMATRPAQAPADESTPDLDPDVEKVVSTRVSQAMAPLNQRIQALSDYADAENAQKLMATAGATDAEKQAVERTWQNLQNDPEARARGLATRAFAVTLTLGQARIAAGPRNQAEAARVAANRGATVESPGGIPANSAPEALPDSFSVFDRATLNKVAAEAEKRLGYNPTTGQGGSLVNFN